MRFRPSTLLLLLLVFEASTSQSQTAPASSSKPEPARTWLGDRFGVTPLERALAVGDARDRERAIERLGLVGGARALEVLVRALEPSGPAQSARERLLCVRALAPHLDQPKARESLVRVMTGISVNAELREPLYAMLRDSAALALASSEQTAAFEALGKALRQPGRVARSAAAAVVAHPPRELAPLLASVSTPTPELVWVLENLGDERAFESLRNIVRRGDPELSARAALALTRLGNFETVELARHWTRTKTGKPRLLLAAAEILMLGGEPSAEHLISALLGKNETHSEALDLAIARPDPRLSGTLLELLAKADRHEAALIVAALGRSGDPAALEKLAEFAAGGDYADAAAYALALSPQKRATSVLRALLDPSTAGPNRRRAARAAVLRRSALGTGYAPSGLADTLEVLLVSREASDRAVAAFGLALGGAERASKLLAHRDPVVVQAAARGAVDSGAAAEAGRRLALARPGPTRSQLALSLVHAAARALVPTRVLLELVAEGGPGAPVALFALGERDSEATRPRIVEHLSSPDPELRSHAAFGLGTSSQPDALGLLDGAYRFEVDPSVRHAVVLGLSLRAESARRRTLELAARLDPSERVRTLARLALSGLRPSPFTPGVGTVWVQLGGPNWPGKMAAKIELPSGLVVPLLADPDGVAALAGLPAGSLGLRLARDLAGDKAPPERP